MENEYVLTVKNLFFDLSLAISVMALFMVLGYISREFALSAQASLAFGDCGFFKI